MTIRHCQVSLTSERDLDADVDEDEERHEVHRAQPEHLLVLVRVVRPLPSAVLARRLSDLL